MWGRAVLILGLLAVVTVFALVSPSSERVAGITVPMQDTGEPVPPTVTAVGVGNTETSSSTPTATVPPASQPSSTSRTSTRSSSAKASTATTATTSTPAGTSQVQVPAGPRFEPSASFRIVNVMNGLTLDSGGQVRPGTPMKLWEPSPSTNLQFQFAETDHGYYRLVNRTNGLAVDGRSATDLGAYLGQSPWGTGPTVQWLPTEVSGGMFTLTNRATGMVLDGGGPGVRSGSPAKQWRPDNSPNLLWRIVRV